MAAAASSAGVRAAVGVGEGVGVRTRSTMRCDAMRGSAQQTKVSVDVDQGVAAGGGQRGGVLAGVGMGVVSRPGATRVLDRRPGMVWVDDMGGESGRVRIRQDQRQQPQRATLQQSL